MYKPAHIYMYIYIYTHKQLTVEKVMLGKASIRGSYILVWEI